MTGMPDFFSKRKKVSEINIVSILDRSYNDKSTLNIVFKSVQFLKRPNCFN